MVWLDVYWKFLLVMLILFLSLVFVIFVFIVKFVSFGDVVIKLVIRKDSYLYLVIYL